MIDRPRLIPAVILGAMGLLALKLLAWTSAPYPGTVPAARLFVAAKAEQKTLAQTPDLLDPMTTGSVDKADPKKAEAGAKDGAKDEAARAANPNNKAGLINGTAQPVSPTERALLERLGQRREEIDQRMREIEMRERLLDSAEKKLEGRFGGEQAAAAPDPAKARAEEDAKAVRNLVIMYEAMKPKDAARVFDRLALDILVPVVQQMNPRKMSEVLATMAPEKAEKLTVALATQGRAAPAERPQLAQPAGSNELQAVVPGTR